MNGKIVAGVIVLIGRRGRCGMYCLQVYAYYEPVSASAPVTLTID